jgi:hypothetical protein
VSKSTTLLCSAFSTRALSMLPIGDDHRVSGCRTVKGPRSMYSEMNHATARVRSSGRRFRGGFSSLSIDFCPARVSARHDRLMLMTIRYTLCELFR